MMSLPPGQRTEALPSAEGPSTAVVASSDEETRVLLRGLLRLHRFRIVGEAEGTTDAGQLVRLHRPAVLLVDSNLAEGSPGSLIAATRSAAPSTRVIVLSPPGRAPAPSAGGAPDVLLPRPFRIQQFAEALGPVSDGRPARPDD
jgi:DNA-binding NarL/FixJ family response regulator